MTVISLRDRLLPSSHETAVLSTLAGLAGIARPGGTGIGSRGGRSHYKVPPEIAVGFGHEIRLPAC